MSTVPLTYPARRVHGTPTAAVALGATERRAQAWISYGFAAIAFVVMCYALGHKLVPGLHIDGVINLDHTGAFPRLQEPLGYWNALALFLVIGVPSTLALAVDEKRSRRWRAAAGVALSMMLVAIGLTDSRGGPDCACRRTRGDDRPRGDQRAAIRDLVAAVNRQPSDASA
jgi:hypothetical protein